MHTDADLEAIMATGEKLPVSLTGDDLDEALRLNNPVFTGVDLVESDEDWEDM